MHFDAAARIAGDSQSILLEDRMKTFRLIALLSLAALAACAEPITAPATTAMTADAAAQTSTGQGFLGGGTK